MVTTAMGVIGAILIIYGGTDPIDQFLHTGKYADTGLHQTESREF